MILDLKNEFNLCLKNTRKPYHWKAYSVLSTAITTTVHEKDKQ